MLEGFLSAALFTLDPNPGQGEYHPDLSSVSPEFREFAAQFVAEFESAFEPVLETLDCDALERVGNYVWYTCAGHGVGFWDGELDYLAGAAFCLLTDRWCKDNGLPCEFTWCFWDDVTA